MTVRIVHFSGTPDRNQYEARLPMLGMPRGVGGPSPALNDVWPLCKNLDAIGAKQTFRGRRKRLDLSKMTQSGY
jgi:hypothetical protein